MGLRLLKDVTDALSLTFDRGCRGRLSTKEDLSIGMTREPTTN